ncbi:hypothetical protein Q8A67_009439 [Cirrhinus molitorella]|uniref:Uncharacterized protein n=1 Tax=Cirrhinus molitorella TaxID=172907 RepID=A0AA88TQI5_9TELE|nr:hypothetical protein Q8A67_009439 [Cirrhinus molitorella]
MKQMISLRNIRHHVGLIKHCCDEENRSAVALRSKHQQSKGFSGSCRASAVLHSERPTRSSADRRVFEHQPLQDTEGLLLLVRVHDGHLPFGLFLFL